jgi:hypothetical protein
MSFISVTNLLQSLKLLANCYQLPVKIASAIFLAEGVGFEPTELSLNGFQDRRLKPLGHPSMKPHAINHFCLRRNDLIYVNL